MNRTHLKISVNELKDGSQAKAVDPRGRDLGWNILFILSVAFFILFSLNILHAREVNGRAINSYVIGPEDVLDIRVWENSKLSVIVPVRPDGHITVPLVGDMLASGLEPLRLKGELEAALSEYIQNPTVTVIVQSINSLNIYLLGDGVPNRVFAPKRELTLMQFLSQIGPLENADLESAFLLRGDEKFMVDFYKLAIKGDLSQDLSLSPGDVVFIPGNFDKRIQVIGAVNNPMTLTYKKGLTILDAVLLAGGLTEFANSKKIAVIRKGGDDGLKSKIVVRFRDIMVKGDLSENIELMPGDMIVVKEGIL